MIKLRALEDKDLEQYRFWNLPDKKHHDYNGPYFGRLTDVELDVKIKTMKRKFEAGEAVMPHAKAIVDEKTDELIGTVSKYFKSKETDWMEIGVVVFNENYWGKGIGYKALKLWTTEIFELYPSFVRLGLTTWSGNKRMMALAEKLGFKKEAEYRKARIVDGQYYDSVSYGILREEWYDE